jgi:pyruvate formate lyase activating enzyme
VKGGTLYTLLYGSTSGVCADPIEKKPLYHFYPGTMVLSMGTRGCNFQCPGCQNWEISHDSPDEFARNLIPLTPEASVDMAIEEGCAGICWTYNDPTIWIEQTLEAMIVAQQRGLYSAYITNAYATPEHLDLIGPHLTAWRADIKGFSKETYKKISKIARWEPVLEMTKLAKSKYGMHVECVTNVTPTINDDPGELRALARWIRADLGETTPWHITRFHPYLDLSPLPPTPIPTLERAYEIGREEGLKYVYLGNVPGHDWENTYCHGCGTLLIERHHFAVRRARLFEGKCPKCGVDIPGRFGSSIEATDGHRRPVYY